MNAPSFGWLVRRELWEHKAIWIAPLAVAILVLAAITIGVSTHVEDLRKFAEAKPDKIAAMVALPYAVAAALVVVTGFVVNAFYALDALYAERRDRSIFFWKSMPVSDAQTVLSKAAIAFIAVPAMIILIALSTQVLVLVITNVVRLVNGLSPVAPGFAPMVVDMAYGVIVFTLWWLPLYAYLMLVSAWAKRMPFLWALGLPVGIMIVEGLAFRSARFGKLLGTRIGGAMEYAWVPGSFQSPVSEFSQLTPISFLSTPGLWLGILFAAACLYGAIRLRRYREPN